jgi:PiT family inorganic phosphate transporter
VSPEALLLLLAGVGGFYMAWNIGANDVANAMGTSVGSKALTLRKAILIAAVFELAGAVLVGGHVTQTVRKGIITPEALGGNLDEYLYGMLAALLAAGIWLQVATRFGLPVSTTHSIVGAVAGFGIVAGGFGAVDWGKMTQIVLSWFSSPLCGGFLGFLVFTIIRRTILDTPVPIPRARVVAPVFVFLTFAIIVLATVYKGLKNLNLHLSFPQAAGLAALVGLVAALIASVLIGRYFRGREGLDIGDQFHHVESVFKYLQILTACAVAFAHGSNDVANAIGPLAGIVSVVRDGVLQAKAEVPLWILVLGGSGIVIGLATWGYKVMFTVGSKITELTPTRGFSAELAAAATIILGTRLSMPISTTHVLVGSVFGVGLARGITALNMRVMRDIFSSWIITVPFTGVLAAVLFLLIRLAFNAMGGVVG